MNITKQTSTIFNCSNLLAPVLKLFFVSTNKSKYQQLKQSLNLDLEFINADIQEIQGTHENIIRDKLEKACRLYPNKYIIVDDSSICLKSLNGFPGPYGKYFLEMGFDVVENLVSKIGRCATLECKLGLGILRNDKLDMNIFSGVIEGEIIQRLNNEQKNSINDILDQNDRNVKVTDLGFKRRMHKTYDDINRLKERGNEDKDIDSNVKRNYRQSMYENSYLKYEKEINYEYKNLVKDLNNIECLKPSAVKNDKLNVDRKQYIEHVYKKQDKNNFKLLDEQFDNMFYHYQAKKFMSEMSLEELNIYSHRSIAVKKLKEYLKENKLINC